MKKPSASLAVAFAILAVGCGSSSASPTAGAVHKCLRSKGAPHLTSGKDAATHLPTFGTTWTDGSIVTIAQFPSKTVMQMAQSFGRGIYPHMEFTAKGMWQASFTQHPTRAQAALVKACI